MRGEGGGGGGGREEEHEGEGEHRGRERRKGILRGAREEDRIYWWTGKKARVRLQ